MEKHTLVTIFYSTINSFDESICRLYYHQLKDGHTDDQSVHLICDVWTVVSRGCYKIMDTSIGEVMPNEKRVNENQDVSFCGVK